MPILLVNCQDKKQQVRDDITTECLQALGERGIRAITVLIKEIYNRGKTLKDFVKSIFVPIFKSIKLLTVVITEQQA